MPRTWYPDNAELACTYVVLVPVLWSSSNGCFGMYVELATAFTFRQERCVRPVVAGVALKTQEWGWTSIGDTCDALSPFATPPTRLSFP